MRTTCNSKAWKFLVLYYRPAPPTSYSGANKDPGGKAIPGLNILRNLGTSMSSDATFPAHTAEGMATCRRMAN